jgi:phage terminase large subunit-like protein
MSPAAKQFEKLLLGRQLAHGGNPVLSWMASNVAVKRDPADNIKPDKAKSRDRIDGIVALVMAAGREMVQIEVEPQIWCIRDDT